MSSISSATIPAAESVPRTVKQTRAFEVVYYSSLVLPAIVNLCFCFLVVRERIYTGHWPAYNDSHPDAPISLAAFISFLVVNAGVGPAITVVFFSVFMTLYAFSRKNLSRKKLLISCSILLINIVALYFMGSNAGGFLEWIRD